LRFSLGAPIIGDIADYPEEECTVKELSQIARNVRASTTMTIDTMFKQMKAEGQDVIGFVVGEPDFPTPDHIKEAGYQAIRENITRYTAASGTNELKEAICRRMKADLGIEYGPDQVVISSGAKHVIYLALRSLIDPGDEVILPTPAYVSYYELIKMVGGTPVMVETTEAEGFKLTADKLRGAITGKTKALILNSPCNPTGMVYDREQLKALTDVCVEEDLYIVADEIYYSLVYDGKPFTSIASLGEAVKERLILVNGVSKSYAMTGWRIGYGLTRPDIAKVMSSYVSHSTGSPCTISQYAAVTAMESSQEQVEVMRQAFEERRNYMVERMEAIPGIHCLKPEGAFYVMTDLRDILGRTLGGEVIHDDVDFATAFLRSQGVAVVPGEGFGAPGYVRWSYATSMENIKKGMDRLEKFLQS